MADNEERTGNTEEVSLVGSDEKQCQFCSNINAKYLCPRCGVRYCSVPCYRNPLHTVCSEDFFKHCIEEELSSSGQDSEGRKQMMEALQRLHEEGVGDDLLDSDDEEEDLASRLENIDLNNAEQVWSSLTATERAEFESLVASGEVDKILPVWTPWWNRPEPALIEELDTPKKADNAPEYPPLVPNIPLFAVICTIKPSPCLDFNLINVLAAYTFTCRHFNGEAEQNAGDAASCMMQLSDNLSANANFNDRDTAVKAVVMNAVNIMKSSPEDTGLIASDVQNILSSKEFVLYALSGAHHILNHAKTQLKISKNIKTNRSTSKQSFSSRFPDVSTSASPSEFVLTKTNLHAAMKKLEYFMSWVKAYYSTKPEISSI